MLVMLGLVILSGWLAVIWLVCLTVKEVGRQKLASLKRTELASKDGGIALVLASELHDRRVWVIISYINANNCYLHSLYLTEKMLAEHKKFRSMYDRIPDDYPDAYTINRAKILQEERLSSPTLIIREHFLSFQTV